MKKYKFVKNKILLIIIWNTINEREFLTPYRKYGRDLYKLRISETHQNSQVHNSLDLCLTDDCFKNVIFTCIAIHSKFFFFVFFKLFIVS